MQLRRPTLDDSSLRRIPKESARRHRRHRNQPKNLTFPTTACSSALQPLFAIFSEPLASPTNFFRFRCKAQHTTSLHLPHFEPPNSPHTAAAPCEAHHASHIPTPQSGRTRPESCPLRCFEPPASAPKTITVPTAGPLPFSQRSIPHPGTPHLSSSPTHRISQHTAADKAPQQHLPATSHHTDSTQPSPSHTAAAVALR